MTKKTILFDLSILISVFIITLIIISLVKTQQPQLIYGTWEGEHQGKELLFAFNNDGTCELNIKNNVSNYTEMITGIFKVDFSKKPIPLTIRNIPQLNHPLHTIIKFIDEDSIRIEYFATRWRLRPISFKKNSSMLLKKVDRNL